MLNLASPLHLPLLYLIIASYSLLQASFPPPPSAARLTRPVYPRISVPSRGEPYALLTCTPLLAAAPSQARHLLKSDAAIHAVATTITSVEGLCPFLISFAVPCSETALCRVVLSIAPTALPFCR